MAFGMVFYTDGGAAPCNPGPAGYGFHGYLYTTEKTTRGTGLAKHYITNRGYIPKEWAIPDRKAKDEKEEIIYVPVTLQSKEIQWPNILANWDEVTRVEVSPVKYFDCTASIGRGSNNLAELKAAVHALQVANDYEIDVVVLRPDSKYVIDGAGDKLDDYQRLGFMQPDGTLKPNHHEWQEYWEALQALKAKGVVVRYEWVRGHNGDFGNTIADRLATIGVIGSNQESTRVELDRCDAQGYWKNEVSKHPFIANRYMYFNTDRNDPGLYFIGEHGKETEFCGKRMGDGAYAVIKLNEPDDSLELIRKLQGDMVDREYLVIAKLEQLYRADIHREIGRHGNYAVKTAGRTNYNLISAGKDPLTEVLTRPLIAGRAIDALMELYRKLGAFQNGDTELTITPLTDFLFETYEKGPKKAPIQARRLKSDYKTNFTMLEVEANYSVGDEIKTAPIKLTVGQDMLSRNALKRIENENPRVSLITWNEDGGNGLYFRYATIIEADSGFGIWCAYYTNIRFLPPK